MDFGTVGNVIGITVICYLAAMAVKATKIDEKWLPVICGILGGMLGVVGLLIMPDYPAEDYISAISIGIVSGLAATGSHQAVKQLVKNGGSADEMDLEVDESGDGYSEEAVG